MPTSASLCLKHAVSFDFSHFKMNIFPVFFLHMEVNMDVKVRNTRFETLRKQIIYTNQLQSVLQDPCRYIQHPFD